MNMPPPNDEIDLAAYKRRATPIALKVSDVLPMSEPRLAVFSLAIVAAGLATSHRMNLPVIFAMIETIRAEMEGIIANREHP